MAEKKNKTIEKARIEMNYLTGDAEVRRLAELREKWEMDYVSGINYARNEGKKEGIEEGEKRGKEIGIKESQIKIAKEMLKKNLPINLISEITKLTEEEINELKS